VVAAFGIHGRERPFRAVRVDPLVKLSAFTVVDGYPPGTNPRRRRLREVVDLARVSEAADLSGLWIAEHHFHAGGVCPHPPALLAACGEATRRLRLGALVSVLPFHDPISLAEEFAVVDQLSEGRLNFGTGSGYLPVEFEGFGIDPATKRDRFDRALDTILRAWRGELVQSDTPGAKPVRLNLQPVQRPHPPLWIAVQRREAIVHVARRGASVALIPYATVGSIEELAAEVGEYRAHATNPSGEVAVAFHVYVGDRIDRAREALQRYLDGRLTTQSTFYRQKVEHDPAAANAAQIESSGFALFGSRSEVRDRLEELAEIGIDELLGILDFGGLDPLLVAQSTREYGATRSGGAAPE
jgi:alkanesulfonate monooxygenase SsuD/methylene tetrahydromethanopterin reductase-like flavin-dependent oxidoreductase (luciferase family)